MKYLLEVQRLKEYPKGSTQFTQQEGSTIGKITLTSEIGQELFTGYTCENLGPSTDTPNQDKRIVARTYELEWTKTSKNGNKKLGKWVNKALLLTCDKELSSFRNRRILVHIGNYSTNTEGCILVGTSQSNNGAINSSVDAINKLFNVLEGIELDNVELVVKEIQ